jgi:hypothetical protein
VTKEWTKRATDTATTHSAGSTDKRSGTKEDKAEKKKHKREERRVYCRHQNQPLQRQTLVQEAADLVLTVMQVSLAFINLFPFRIGG